MFYINFAIQTKRNSSHSSCPWLALGCGYHEDNILKDSYLRGAYWPAWTRPGPGVSMSVKKATRPKRESDTAFTKNSTSRFDLHTYYIRSSALITNGWRDLFLNSKLLNRISGHGISSNGTNARNGSREDRHMSSDGDCSFVVLTVYGH